MVGRRREESSCSGLEGLRERGRVTEILFLYEITIHRHANLLPIARSLKVTVQAASHVFRQLVGEGLVQVEEGSYRPTVKGIAALHESLNNLSADLYDRVGRLRVIRSTRALAERDLRKGEPVVLRMSNGTLTATPGKSGGSRGRARMDTLRGSLVEVEELEGVLPLVPEPVCCVVVEPTSLDSPGAIRELRSRLHSRQFGLVAAEGLEAQHLLASALGHSVARFGVASAAREAALMGVPTFVAVSAERLPGFLRHVSEPPPGPKIVISSLKGH